MNKNVSNDYRKSNFSKKLVQSGQKESQEKAERQGRGGGKKRGYPSTSPVLLS